MKLTDEMIEKAFQEWVKTEPNRNKVPESRFEHIAAEHAFKAAFALLAPVIERQNEALEKYERYMPVFEPEGCCNGRDCACLGKPTNPEYYLNSLAKITLAFVREQLGKMGGER